MSCTNLVDPRSAHARMSGHHHTTADFISPGTRQWRCGSLLCGCAHGLRGVCYRSGNPHHARGVLGVTADIVAEKQRLKELKDFFFLKSEAEDSHMTPRRCPIPCLNMRLEPFAAVTAVRRVARVRYAVGQAKTRREGSVRKTTAASAGSSENFLNGTHHPQIS